jgi:hypothetical protein
VWASVGRGRRVEIRTITAAAAWRAVGLASPRGCLMGEGSFSCSYFLANTHIHDIVGFLYIGLTVALWS